MPDFTVSTVRHPHPEVAPPSSEAPPPHADLDTAHQALSSLQHRLTPDARDLPANRIDWATGTAELFDKRGTTRSLLRIPALQDDRTAATLAASAASMRALVDAAGRLLACGRARADSDPDCWSLPTVLTLDGRVLRAESIVLGRLAQEPDARGDRWQLRPDAREFGFLCVQRQWPRAQPSTLRRRHGAAFDGPPLPTLASNRAPSQREPGRFDETWVVQVGGDHDLTVTTLLANSLRERVRLFKVEPVPNSTAGPTWLREIAPNCIPNGWDELDGDRSATNTAVSVPAPLQTLDVPRKPRSGARTPIPDGGTRSARHDDTSDLDAVCAGTVVRPRVMVVGDSQREHGDPEPRAGHYDAVSLAHMLKRAADTVAARDGASIQAPGHVSIVSSHQQAHAFRRQPSDAPEPSFGARFLTTLTEVFEDPSITVSMRTDGYRIAYHHPHSEDHDGRYEHLDPSDNAVYMPDPSLEGRKFVRTADGRYLNKAPGGTVLLSRRADGTIRQVDKYPDLGQAHVADTTQQTPPQFVHWLSSARDASPRTNGLPEAGPRFLMGEVIVDRGLLARMGWQDAGQDLAAPGAYLRLRFEPDDLAALLRGGEPPERVAAMRVLKQMMRDGMSAKDIIRPSTARHVPASAAGAMTSRLHELDASLDDQLLLSTSVWQALWHGRDDCPPLPRSVPAKDMAPL